MIIGFTKMHGLGNDFVVIDNMNGRIKLSPEQVVALCDRHFGIGADGLILVEPSEEVDSTGSPQADCFMNYYNSDGSVGLCGNGLRCTTKFLKDEIYKSKDSFKVDTCAGIKYTECTEGGIYSVNMGKPMFSHQDFPDHSIELENLALHFVSTGNPHAVALVQDLKLYDLSVLGPKIENNLNFPNKINFELVEELSPTEFKMKVWERGCGITLACGTGATGVYAVLRKYKNVPEEITLELPGGKLFFKENKEGEIIMRGPAASVFTGMVEML